MLGFTGSTAAFARGPSSKPTGTGAHRARLLRACEKSREGSRESKKWPMARRGEGASPLRAVTEPQRRQRPFFALARRVASLLALAGVARRLQIEGYAPSSRLGQRQNSLQRDPSPLFSQALTRFGHFMIVCNRLALIDFPVCGISRLRRSNGPARRPRAAGPGCRCLFPASGVHPAACSPASTPR